jgi:putative aldouronate transport system substrate-binding protein
LTFPKNPPRATQGTPGKGGEVSFFVGAYYPPSTPLDQNPPWQEVNKQLGVTVKMNIVGLSDQNARLATLIAGDDLPDFIHMTGGWAGAPNLPQFAEVKCADLTPYLSGDAIKDYPNLAALPTTAWRHTVYNGKILSVPIHRPAVTSLLFRNQTVWDQEFGKDAVPKTADDYKRMLVQLTKPAQQQWGYGAYVAPVTGVALDVLQFSRLFGAPNRWRLEPNGALTNERETAEYRAAVAYMRDLWSAGVFHPDGLNWPGVVPAQEAMIGGRTMTMSHSMAYYNDLWRRGATANPPVVFRATVPFSNDGTAKPVYHFGTRIIGTTALKKAPPERIKELLSIMNWLAAPFGTEEALLLEYGVPEVDYQLDDRGNPIPTERGVRDSAYVPWRYMAQHPFTQYQADLPEYSKQAQADTKAHVPFGLEDPTLGLYSTTSATKNVPLTQHFAEATVDIVVGRRPMEDYEALVREWQSGGGDQIRQEFQKALAA